MDKIYTVLMVLAALILIYILWCFIEPFILDMDRAVLKRSPADDPSADKINIRKLPMVTDGISGQPDLRFFFFSDTHAEWCPVTSKRLCNAIRKAHSSNPLDAVIFGGDIVTYPHNIRRGYKYMSDVSNCCKELGIPFYGITGNHDHGFDDNSGAPEFFSLDNTEIALTSHKDGTTVKLAGLTDSGRKNRIWYSRTPCKGSDPVILAVHDPDAFIHLDADARPDFMLSGHLHGGQMKFPFRIEFCVLRRSDKLPNMGAVQGVYNINGTSVFISRGLGCGILPFRFLSLPEATVVEIHL